MFCDVFSVDITSAFFYLIVYWKKIVFTASQTPCIHIHLKYYFVSLFVYFFVMNIMEIFTIVLKAITMLSVCTAYVQCCS